MNSSVINEDEILATMPSALIESKKIKAIGYAVSAQIKKRRDSLKKINYYAHFDELDEDILDAIAISLGCEWYNFNYDIETKRRLLKMAGVIKRREGTEWAVEQVIKAICGNTVKIKYWYEDKEGELITNQFEIVTAEGLNEDEIRQCIERVKRASALYKGVRKVPTFDGEYLFDGTICFDSEIK